MSYMSCPYKIISPDIEDLQEGKKHKGVSQDRLANSFGINTVYSRQMKENFITKEQ